MNTTTPGDVLGAAAIAKELGISEAKVKKAIKELDIQPAAKRGICAFYARESIPQIQAAASAPKK
ncbi:MAG: hypothetical protein RBS40_15670 [Rhodocyclaceae bacterium]|jgi:hypothetical protein|nr:hypothetical protein [Rhodocyclaceae bacterium]